MESICVTLEFPKATDAEVNAAVARYTELSEVAERLGGAPAVWKISEGWCSFRLRTAEACARFQSEAVPLPVGWAMRIGEGLSRKASDNQMSDIRR